MEGFAAFVAEAIRASNSPTSVLFLCKAMVLPVEAFTLNGEPDVQHVGMDGLCAVVGHWEVRTDERVKVLNIGVLKPFLKAICLPIVQTVRDPTHSTNWVDVDSTGLLFASPVNYQLWNNRRRSFQRKWTEGQLDTESVIEELRFVGLITSLHPKAPEAWSYRQWFLQKVLNDASADLLAHLLPLEWYTVSMFCEEHPRNYPAWHYRGFLVGSLLDAIAATTAADGKGNGPLIAELDNNLLSIAAWVERHLRDFSAVHHALTTLERCGRSQVLEVVSVAKEHHFAFFLISQRLIRRCVEQPWAENCWLLRKGLVRLMLHYPSIFGCRGWCWEDELLYISLFVDGIRPSCPSSTSGDASVVDAAEMLGRAVNDNVVFAARYGAWLCDELQSLWKTV